MKTSRVVPRVVTYVAAIAVAVSLLGAAVFFPASTNDAANPPETTASPATTSLEPIIVVATR